MPVFFFYPHGKVLLSPYDCERNVVCMNQGNLAKATKTNGPEIPMA
jgi:hypothetical protein